LGCGENTTTPSPSGAKLMHLRDSLHSATLSARQQTELGPSDLQVLQFPVGSPLGCKISLVNSSTRTLRTNTHQHTRPECIRCGSSTGAGAGEGDAGAGAASGCCAAPALLVPPPASSCAAVPPPFSKCAAVPLPASRWAADEAVTLPPARAVGAADGTARASRSAASLTFSASNSCRRGSAPRVSRR